MTFSSDRNSAQNFEELCSHLFSYDKIDWRILLISDMLINFCYPKKLMTAEFSNNFNRCKTVLKPSNTKILFLDTRIPLDILNNYVVICFLSQDLLLQKAYDCRIFQEFRKEDRKCSQIYCKLLLCIIITCKIVLKLSNSERLSLQMVCLAGIAKLP